MSEATPRPWSITADGLIQSVQHQEPITRMVSPSLMAGSLVAWQANAELIVRAVNLFDDLLHAIYVAHGTFARQLDPDGMGPDSWGDDEHEAFTVLTAALAKAEARQDVVA